MARSDHHPATTDTATDPSGLWHSAGLEPGMMEDPRVQAEFLWLLAEQHHMVGDSRQSTPMCSCGEPYLACPVALQIRPMLAASAQPTGGASHWFG